MKFLKAFLSVSVTMFSIWALQTKFGDIPPLGKFLNPATGFWQNAENNRQLNNQSLSLIGLHSKVIINYDEHMIPHIFANNDHDLYFAQGYITAQDRLWQMDIQTRSAAGRLAEVLGPKGLGHDLYERRMGMVYGAENTTKKMMTDPVMKEVLLAYAEGVNCFINNLKCRDYPIEFKLLDYKPEEWKPINSAFLLKLMSETLAGGSDQFAMTNDLNKFGINDMNDLFPDQQFNNEYIIPQGIKWPFKALVVPKQSENYQGQLTAGIRPHEKVDEIGSNNWAVNGSKTKTGYPILANDPHLTLSFPSIWYQVQLTSPTVNVNGVSLPGAPCVIIGFNQKISWGVTNVGAAVLDWYEIRFKDKTKNEYWYDNRWNNVTHRVEIIKVRGQKTVNDTVIYTHHGPVVYESSEKKKQYFAENIPVGDALRWVAHDPSNDIKTFYLLNRARNYTDYRNALTDFTAPAQNFIFASTDNDIAITANGKFPLKYKDQGKFILDGSNPNNDWQGWIPSSQNPSIKNPQRGFVSSANQSIADSSYPYYINWEFGSYYRGKRINDRLEAMHYATVDSMRLLQIDDYSILAQDVLPTILKYLDPSKMDSTQLRALNFLKKWNKHYDSNSYGASIFDECWQQFYKMIWTNKFWSNNVYLKSPSEDRTEKLLLTEPNSKWFYDTKTRIAKNISQIVNDAFFNAVSELNKQKGPISRKWQWGKVKHTHIDHMANLRGFGSGNLIMGGKEGAINALENNFGPSWRMVVQMGPTVRGYGILPGGESGNPGSYYYDDMLPIWKQGNLSELLFMQKPNENDSWIKRTITLMQ
jgi:penicillin amidase